MRPEAESKSNQQMVGQTPASSKGKLVEWRDILQQLEAETDPIKQHQLLLRAYHLSDTWPTCMVGERARLENLNPHILAENYVWFNHLGMEVYRKLGEAVDQHRDPDIQTLRGLLEQIENIPLERVSPEELRATRGF